MKGIVGTASAAAVATGMAKLPEVPAIVEPELEPEPEDEFSLYQRIASEFDYVSDMYAIPGHAGQSFVLVFTYRCYNGEDYIHYASHRRGWEPGDKSHEDHVRSIAGAANRVIGDSLRRRD